MCLMIDLKNREMFGLVLIILLSFVVGWMVHSSYVPSINAMDRVDFYINNFEPFVNKISLGRVSLNKNMTVGEIIDVYNNPVLAFHVRVATRTILNDLCR